MTEQQKANAYGQLLNEHTRLHNQVNEIKSQNQDMTFEQKKKVMELQARQVQIMNNIKKLFT
jgi:hypothetical protein